MKKEDKQNNDNKKAETHLFFIAYIAITIITVLGVILSLLSEWITTQLKR